MIATIAMLMTGAGFILGTFGVARMQLHRNAALRELLEDELDKPTRTPQDMSELMERAGAFAERAIGKTESAGRLRFKLMQAGSTMKVGEFSAMAGIGTGVAAALTLLLAGSPYPAIGVLVLGPVFAYSYVSRKARKRVAKLESQLPEVLALVAGALDAGTSLLVAFELAGEEGEAPLSTELGRVVAESGVGRPLLEALDAMSERIGSRDISWTAKAIRIQHQTGGKLADTLRILAEFMAARQEVRGEIKALSAEARISGKILVGMPIAMGAFFYISRRAYLEPLLTTPIGKTMIGGACISILIGHLWMKKMSNVEI